MGRSVAVVTQYSGETGEGVAAARAALAARDRALSEADRALSGVLGEAYRCALEAIRRIETVQSDIDGIGENPDLDDRARARLLLECHRELTGAVTAVRDHSAAKTLELQHLSAAYDF